MNQRRKNKDLIVFTAVRFKWQKTEMIKITLKEIVDTYIAVFSKTNYHKVFVKITQT